jgi:hypothetical protein
VTSFLFGRGVLVVLAALLVSATPPAPVPHDSLQFTDQATAEITADTISLLDKKWRIALPEQSDTAPLYLNDVDTQSGVIDLLIVETNQGQVVGIDALNGQTIWSTIPPIGIRWTTSTPAVDPERRFVYAYCLDGYVHKYAVYDGKEFTGQGWPQLMTAKSEVEKGSSAIRIAKAKNGHTYLYMPMAAYPDPGDDGDYQGHVTTIDLGAGDQWVFNAACSDKSFHLLPTFDEHDCSQQQSGIWGRAGVVYDPSLDRIFVTIGNGVYDADRGGYNWGSSVVALKPDGSTDNGVPLDSYTPVDHQRLTDQDLDLSSSAVEILPAAASISHPHLGVLIGKDGVLRLLNLADLSGKRGPRHIGGELATVTGLPWVLTRPVAWRDSTGRTWIFVVNDRAVLAYSLAEKSGVFSFVKRWQRNDGGTSPILVNGVLYYARTNRLTAVDARTGKAMWSDKSIGPIHWQTPIVAGSSLYICDGSGLLWRYDNTYVPPVIKRPIPKP